MSDVPEEGEPVDSNNNHRQQKRIHVMDAAVATTVGVNRPEDGPEMSCGNGPDGVSVQVSLPVGLTSVKLDREIMRYTLLWETPVVKASHVCMNLRQRNILGQTEKNASPTKVWEEVVSAALAQFDGGKLEGVGTPHSRVISDRLPTNLILAMPELHGTTTGLIVCLVTLPWQNMSAPKCRAPKARAQPTSG